MGVGYWMVLLYAFFVHSRIVELLAPGLRLPLVLALGGLALAMLSSTIVRGFNSLFAVAFLLLTGWFFFGVPFSAHPSGSLRFLTDAWIKNWALFIMIVALVNSRRHCSRMMAVLAFGSTVAAVGALLTGFPGPVRQVERLALEGSSLNDPNTLGMTMLIGLPMWMVVIGDRSRNLLSRIAAALCTIPIFVATPMTGSRGTLVAAAIVGIYLFKRFSVAGKTGLIVAVSLVVILAGAFLTEGLMQRYTTVVDPDQVGETAATESRVHLFKQGLHLIARNPITGVGVGMFAVAENDLAISQGMRRGTWHTCHNMFMQVASEGGIPAIVLYFFILWTVWKTLGLVERVTPDEHPRAAQVVRLAFWMRITFLAFCACGLFLSSGLSPTFVILTSLPMAFARIVRAEVAQLEHEKNAAAGDDLPMAPLPRLDPMAAPLRGLRGA